MTHVECPACGEEDRLRGTRKGEAIHIVCEVCGKRWQRDAVLRCAYCQSVHLEYRPLPLFSAGRGTMRTATGKRDSWTCLDCGVADATRKP